MWNLKQNETKNVNKTKLMDTQIGGPQNGKGWGQIEMGESSLCMVTNDDY